MPSVRTCFMHIVNQMVVNPQLFLIKQGLHSGTALSKSARLAKLLQTKILTACTCSNRLLLRAVPLCRPRAGGLVRCWCRPAEALLYR